MKNYFDKFEPSFNNISRRHLGILALGATLSACGGSGDADEPAAPVANGEVVPSTWSDAVPDISNDVFARTYAGVGANGLIYIYGTEKFNDEFDYVVKQYKPDGTLLSTTRLPPKPTPALLFLTPESLFLEQVVVIEVPFTNDILVSAAFSAPSGMINTKFTAGGYIARLNTASGEMTKLFESGTICPGGLARDTAGNLYTIDMKTGDVLQLSAGKNEITVLYSAKPGKSASAHYDFVWDAKCTVAVTTDGTVYATLVTGGHYASSASYNDGQWIVRLRNGQADRIQPGLSDRREIRGFGAHENDVFCLVHDGQTNTLVRKIDATGAISTVAGTPGSNQTTQFGSPGALGRTTQWVDISPDGRTIHLRQAQDNPRFYNVLLPAHS